MRQPPGVLFDLFCRKITDPFRNIEYQNIHHPTHTFLSCVCCFLFPCHPSHPIPPHPNPIPSHPIPSHLILLSRVFNSTCDIIRCSEVVLKEMGNIFQYQTTGKHKQLRAVCIFLGMHSKWLYVSWLSDRKAGWWPVRYIYVSSVS